MSPAAPQELETRPERLAKALAGLLSPATVIRTREPLARRTTFRVGGPADLFAEPASEEDLAVVLRFCAAEGLAVLVLGRGSNLLVRDGGFRGLVLHLGQPEFSRLEAKGARLLCGAGVKLKALAVTARQHALSGLEFLEGIPGTVGGALRMNAGAMGAATFERVEWVRCMDYSGNIHQLEATELRPAYRSCPGLQGRVAVRASFLGAPGDAAQIDARMRQFSQKRWSSQPAAPSAGCIFKNPETIPAGKLIDELGLKGTRVGGAAVSQEHANFIVNEGSATAAEVLGLIELIRDRARTQRGIELETEVEIVGE